ncbi:MAG: hypothetical protein ACLTMP_04245 [Eggerthella lenta]
MKRKKIEAEVDKLGIYWERTIHPAANSCQTTEVEEGLTCSRALTNAINTDTAGGTA